MEHKTKHKTKHREGLKGRTSEAKYLGKYITYLRYWQKDLNKPNTFSCHGF